MQATRTAELVIEPSKRDKRGQRWMPRAQREELVRAYEASGLTMAAFAREAGIKYPTFASWVKSHSGSSDASVAPECPTKPRFAEVSLPFGSLGSSELSVTLPNGLIVRGTSTAELADLVRLLLA